MNTTQFFIFFAVAAIIGIIFAIYAFKRPTIIKFSYCPVEWIEPILLSGALFMAVFLIELLFSMFMSNKVFPNNAWSLLWKISWENGLLVPLICLGLSYFFIFICEKLNLDYLPAYNKKIPGVCLSIIAIITCIIIFIKIFVMEPELDTKDKDYVFLMSRIVMWLGASLSTFVGFGCGYRGRLEKEKMIRTQIASAPQKDPEKKKIYIPIIIYLLLYAVIMGLVMQERIISTFSSAFIGAVLGFSIFSIVTILIAKSILMPGDNASERRLIRVLNAYEKNKVIKTHYGRNEYYIENGTVHISQINVDYPESKNKDTLIELFGKKDPPYLGRTELSDFLKKRTEAQKTFIQNGFEECAKRKKEEKLSKLQ